MEARRVAIAQMEHFQAKLDAARQTQDAKKRKLFAELKQQMVTDLKVRTKIYLLTIKKVFIL